MSEELEVLKEVRDLLRTLLKVHLSVVAEKHITTQTARDIYENTGKMSVVELSKDTGVSTGKISGMWSEWERLGLLVKTGKSYRKPY